MTGSDRRTAPIRVLLTTSPDAHGVYREIVAAPPRHVQVSYIEGGGILASTVARGAARRGLQTLRLPNVGLAPAAAGDADLLHSCQQLLLTTRPWVVDIEHGQPFVGTRFSRLHNPLTRRTILAMLASPACRAIVPWTATALSAFVAVFEPGDRVLRKIRVVHPARRPSAPGSGDAPSDECRLLFVANAPEYNVYLKGGRELVQAFRLLQISQRRKVSLTIVGPTPAPFQQSCAALSGITLTGPVSLDALDALYRRANVYVMPTFSDTFGMVFLEAMSYGLPIVALDRPYTREVISHEATGLLVPVPDSAVQWCMPDGRFTMDSDDFIDRVLASTPDPPLVSSLAQTLDRVINDLALRRRLGSSAREETLGGRFSIARRNAALYDVYRHALQS
jgi:hypothetical protein